MLDVFLCVSKGKNIVNKQALTPNQHRKIWVDFLRGFAMLLVIWGHLAKTEHLFFVVTGPFKMPLFFAITGYVFNDGGNVKQFLINLWSRIIIPWVVLSLVWAKVIWAIIVKQTDSISVCLYDFISGKHLWFIPCFIISECCFFLIRTLIKKRKNQYLVLVSISLFGLLMSNYGYGRFAMFDVACVSQSFLLFGYWFKNNETILLDKFGRLKQLLMLGTYIALLFISLVSFPGLTIDVHNNVYYNYMLCCMLIFTSLLTLFLIASTNDFQSNFFFRWVVFVGQNTLVFYIMHYYSRFIIKYFLQITKLPFDSFKEFFIGFVFVCITMTLAAFIINRYFPIVLGKNKTENS